MSKFGFYAFVIVAVTLLSSPSFAEESDADRVVREANERAQREANHQRDMARAEAERAKAVKEAKEAKDAVKEKETKDKGKK